MKPWLRSPTPLSRAAICGVRPPLFSPSFLIPARYGSGLNAPYHSRCLSRLAGTTPARLSGRWTCRDCVRRREQVRCATYQTTNAGPQGGPNLPFNDEEAEEQGDGKKGEKGKGKGEEGWGSTAFKMFESALTTFASIAILGAVGYSYTIYYKRNVLRKMENAFKPGDPVLDLAARGKDIDKANETDENHWVIRDDQAKIDAIVNGTRIGAYHLLIGEKGTGKSSMLIDAMAKIDGEGVAMLEAHADLEIFRVRLGKALDFEYHEDNIGALFSIRGPRDASALLDIERAFNKLEKVALKRRETVGRPLILIINSAHLLRDDDDGRDLLELIQQRAEQWAASNLATIIINSDDYWVYERLKQLATRMEVTAIMDLSKERAIQALKKYRMKYHGELPSSSILEQVYDKVGGRLNYLNRVARNRDMLKVCDDINKKEKTWFLNQCWILGEEMDDDVMDQQKYASAAMVLAKALVEREKEMTKTYDPELGHILPQIPLHEARQIMTRADFIQSYDNINIFTIDSNAMVRADSVPMQNAFREVCSQEGFDDFLEATLDRISAIESLGRTREITIKDLWNKGKYHFSTANARGNLERKVTMEVEAGKDDEDDEKA